MRALNKENYFKVMPSEVKLFFKLLEGIDRGEVTLITPENEEFIFTGKDQGVSCEIKVYDWTTVDDLFLRGDIGLGEAYMDGKWSSRNVSEVIQFGIENEESLGRVIKGNILRLLTLRLKHFLNRNTVKGSRRNIQAHYDLGNDFYKIWLDETMTYSSALFKGEDKPLCVAQTDKYLNLVKNMKLTGEESVLEIGSGWSGMFSVLNEYNVDFKSVTISKEQFEWVKEKIERENLKGKIEFQDYREVDGKFDYIVSVEMFEAIGKEYWKKYLDKVNSLLFMGGKALIQTITINDDDYKSYSKGTDFIQQYIFPGGMLPSPKVFERMGGESGFVVREVEEFGLSYAKTLECWKETFNENITRVKSLGFDDRFIKMWNFYFDYCIGGFKARKISVYQYELTKAVEI